LSITSTCEADVVIISVKDDNKFESILDYMSTRIDEWGNSQVLWDMTLYNFQSIDSVSIRNFISRSKSFSNKRAGIKTAILVDSDLGFGMMRMLQLIADDKLQVVLNVFRNKEKALQWLDDEEGT